MARTTTIELAEARRLARSGEARAIREKAGVSQAEVAAALGVHETTVARWEKGVRSPRGPVAQRYGRLIRSLRALGS